MYEVVVVGHAERTVRVALQDLVDECQQAEPGGDLVLRITDQARLVAVIDRLHELAIPIGKVDLV